MVETMSTWVYLACLDHTPPLMAEEESGQHLTDLTQIRSDIARRDVLVPLFLEGDFSPDDYFRRHTIRFLSHHPTCNIGIRDEYGRDHAVTE